MKLSKDMKEGKEYWEKGDKQPYYSTKYFKASGMVYITKTATYGYGYNEDFKDMLTVIDYDNKYIK